MIRMAFGKLAAAAVFAVVVASAASGCGGGFATVQAVGQTSTHSIAPAADARVLSGSKTANTNYGSSALLGADLSPDEISYLRFDVPYFVDPIVSARLRINVTERSADGPGVKSADNNWGESTVTYNNRPALAGGLVADTVSLPTGWTEFDVSTIVQQQGTYTLALVGTSRDGAAFASRESSTDPELLVTTQAPTEETTTGETTEETTTSPPSPTETLVGAGDIASCGQTNDEATAKLVRAVPGTVFTVGDNAYMDGTLKEYNDCYGPTWGTEKARTRPTPGNHEYNTSGAAGYFDYFGAAAGERGKGYYSYDLGAWHIVALNSNIPMGAGSEQLAWLDADLAATTKGCSIAYYHHSRYSSSSQYGDDKGRLGPVWDVLLKHSAEVAMSGHAHVYERFAAQDNNSSASPDGVVQFTVGNGGNSLHGFAATPRPNSLVRYNAAYGVLRLTLKDGGLDFEARNVNGVVYDSGSLACH